MMNDHVFYANVVDDCPIIDRGEGIYMWDVTGKRYIDASSGPLVSNIGHGVKEIRDAAYAQMEKIEFAHRLKFSNPPLQKLSDLIVELSDGLVDWVHFCSGGSEATETALVMDRSYFMEKGMPGKYKVVTRRQSYHGATMGSRSMGGRTSMRKDVAPLLINMPHVEPCYCYRCPYKQDPASCALECADAFESAILREGPDTVAAILIEPIGGSTIGATVPPEGYMKRLREICDKYDVLMMVDEVMTGVGRMGKFLATQHWDVKPDIICMAKGLCSGYAPVGAVGCRDFVHEAVVRGSGGFWHGHTLASNPVAMAVGVAVLTYVKEHDLIDNAARMGEYLMEKLCGLREKYPEVGDVRGRGLMTALELVQDRKTRAPYDPKLNLTNRILACGRENGIMLYGAGHCIDGTNGDAFMISPPLSVTKEQIDEIIEYTDRVMGEVFKNLR